MIEPVGPVSQPPDPGQPRALRGPAAILAVVAIAGIVGGAVAAGVTLGVLRLQSRTNSQELNLGSRVTLTEDSAVLQVAGKAAPAVVSVVRDATGTTVPGSGFLVTRDGFVVTSVDAVAGATALAVVTASDRQRRDARVVDIDCRSDLAIIKVDGVQNLPTLSFGDSTALKPGQTVVALAGPLAPVAEVARGTAAALHRSVAPASGTARPPAPASFADTIQAEIALDPADTGDPLLNAAGQVVGVVVAGGDRIRSAVPQATIQAEVEQVVAGGRLVVPDTGLDWVDLDAGAPALRSQPQGALVRSVAAAGPGEAAGVRPGDVLTAIDEVRVDGAHPLQQVLVTKFRPGQRVAVSLQRGSAATQVQLTLAAGHPSCS